MADDTIAEEQRHREEEEHRQAEEAAKAEEERRQAATTPLNLTALPVPTDGRHHCLFPLSLSIQTMNNRINLELHG